MRSSASCEQQTVAALRARNEAATQVLKSASPAWQEKRRSTKGIRPTASSILPVKEELEMLRKVAPLVVLTCATRLACVGYGSSFCEIPVGWTCVMTAKALRRIPRRGCACSAATGGVGELPNTAANTRRRRTRTRTLWPCRGTPRRYGECCNCTILLHSDSQLLCVRMVAVTCVLAPHHGPTQGIPVKVGRTLQTRCPTNEATIDKYSASIVVALLKAEVLSVSHPNKHSKARMISSAPITT